MISGATVTVSRPTQSGQDRFGNATYGEPYVFEVGNVLIQPGATSDLEASRPEGVTIAYTLHFPKECTESLEGCTVSLPAPYSGSYAVVGDPRPYMDGNTPTPWNRTVEIGGAHG